MGSFLIACPLTNQSLSEQPLQSIFIVKNIAQGHFKPLGFSFQTHYEDYGYVNLENYLKKEPLNQILLNLFEKNLKVLHDSPTDPNRYSGRDFNFLDQFIKKDNMIIPQSPNVYQDGMNNFLSAMNDGRMIFKNGEDIFQLALMSIKRDAYKQIIAIDKKNYLKDFKVEIKNISDYIQKINQNNHLNDILDAHQHHLNKEEKIKIIFDNIFFNHLKSIGFDYQLSLSQDFYEDIINKTIKKDDLQILFEFKQQVYESQSLKRYFDALKLKFQINYTCGQDYGNDIGKNFKQLLSSALSDVNQENIDDFFEKQEHKKTLKN